MGFVVEDECKRVFEYGDRLIETDTVFANIGFGFGGIPLEARGPILHYFTGQ